MPCAHCWPFSCFWRFSAFSGWRAGFIATHSPILLPSFGEARPLVHGLSREDLTAWISAAGQPPYRVAQVWSWLYDHRVSDWDAMTNLPRRFRDRLAQAFDLRSVRRVASEEADGGTTKLLMELRDGERIEEVLIPARNRRTVCVSSQVGCRLHCAFCASGKAGFRRQLEAGEIVGQVLLAAEAWGRPPSHVVLMGIGEPLDNYDAVLKAVRILNDQKGLNIGARRITLSTCGVIPGIRRLAGEGLQIELSVSLHAPEDDLRRRLMPVARAYPLDQLLETCRWYTEQTGRIITFEYTLIDGVNDAPRQARALAALLRPVRGRVNLIPLSPVEEFEGKASSPSRVTAFQRILESAGLNVTVRVSRGIRARAACGQLRWRSPGRPT